MIKQQFSDLKPIHYSGVFEAHITIDLLDTHEKIKFQDLCEDLSIKAIQIELARGDAPVQPMTCSRHQGNFVKVFEEVKTLANHLTQAGFEVSRLKIEASPFNEGIPQNNADLKNHSDKNYFEHHLKVLISQEQNRETLLAVCAKYRAHLSRNAFKTFSGGEYENFITLRLYEMGKKESDLKFENLKKEVQNAGFIVQKSITEYCVYDDNIALDNNWLINTSPCLNCNQDCF